MKNPTPLTTKKSPKTRTKPEDGRMPTWDSPQASHPPSTLRQITSTNPRTTTQEEDRLKKTPPKVVIRSFSEGTGQESLATTVRATQSKNPMTVCNVGGCKPAYPTATKFQESPNLISMETVPTINSSTDFIRMLATSQLQKRTSLLIF